jgi:hypothetical protein
VAVLNAWLGRAFDLLLAPVGQFPPIVGVAAMALLTAVPMLLVFRAVSDQPKLVAVKRAIVGGLFEIRLFNDDLSAIFRAQGEILRHNLHYLRLSLVPMLWLIVPLGLTVAHLEYHFGYTGPASGQPVVVKATLRSDRAPDFSPEALRIEVPPHVRVLTPAVWFPAAGEVLWQVSADTPGEYELRLLVGAESVVKTLHVAGGVARRSPKRLERSFINQLAYPAERPLPDDSAMSSVSVGYETAGIALLGWNVPWLFVYFGLTVIFALPLKKLLGVTL